VRQVLPLERTLRIPGAVGLSLSGETSEGTIVEGDSVMAALQNSAYGTTVAGLWSWRRQRVAATAGQSDRWKLLRRHQRILRNLRRTGSPDL